MPENHSRKTSASSRAPAKRQSAAAATKAPAKEPTRNERLKQLEQVIDGGLKSFIEVGNALLEIRESRLYLLNYRSFEEYCLERWGLSKPYASQQIAAARDAEKLTRALEAAGQGGNQVAIGNHSPIKNERQARAIRGRIPMVVKRVEAGESPEEAVESVVHEVQQEKRTGKRVRHPRVHAAPKGWWRGAEVDAHSELVGRWLTEGWTLLSDQGGVDLLHDHTDQTRKLVALLRGAGWLEEAGEETT